VQLRRNDVEAVGELAGEALAAASGLIQEMHEGIASRPFGALGSSTVPVRTIHDGVARTVYGGLRSAFRVVPRGGAAIWARAISDEGRSLDATSAGSIVLAAINGLYGDRIKRRGSALAYGTEIRRDATEVVVTANGLAGAFPDATSRLAVFVHGLCETDESWSHLPLGGDRRNRRTYGERLQDELSYTPVYVRYNTGLHVSDNGRELAGLLCDLVVNWPVEVAEIVLVGHSMGGLVARSACHYAEEDSHPWTHAVRHVFCLGSPHLGADLEKGLNVLGWALARLPETCALGSFVNARSAGIKDMRFGSCAEEDWRDCDPDEFLRDRCQEVPFLPDAHYYFVATSVTEVPLGSILGDLLVRVPSASGRGNSRGRRIPFEIDNGFETTGLTHFDLLNHPAVYEQLRGWVTRAPRAVALVPRAVALVPRRVQIPAASSFG
jgi:pimeloyl-ACP methyl ester carboxylesterase